jgi:3-isopropylmalate/(R)-2-methylmalate dehydratase small subunit
VDVFKKYCLIQGLDDIGLTLENKEDIKGFEIKYYNQYPWLK